MGEDKKVGSILSADIGNTIKMLRVQKKMSQADLSHEVKQATSYVSRIEAGKYNLSVLLLEVYINALDVTFTEFFELVEKNKKKDE